MCKRKCDGVEIDEQDCVGREMWSAEPFSDKRSGGSFPVLVCQRHAARTLRVRWNCKYGA